jgi:uncharacterized SAM-binding protein YcdF (DUF218 family)
MQTLLRLKTLLKSVVLPPAGLLLLAILGVFLIKRRPALARACLILGLGSLWLLSTPLVSNVVVGLADHYPPLDLRNTADAQAIVVLGGGGQRAFAPEYGGPAADPYLLERLTYGAYVARKTNLPILVTGFRIEAGAMRDTLLRNFDISARWVDDQSYDTFENARNSVRLLKAAGINRIILVTHATHMWRSVHEFTAAGIEVVPAPVGILERDYSDITSYPDVMSYVPHAEALLRACAAINELLGEPVREFLAASHLRRH